MLYFKHNSTVICKGRLYAACMISPFLQYGRFGLKDEKVPERAKNISFILAGHKRTSHKKLFIGQKTGP
jgi:hypothetical protein